MSEKEYDLKESAEKLGKLVPVLKDAFGNVIDGLHRLQFYPDWPSITLGNIDTPAKLEMARIAVNQCRRTVNAEERAEGYGKVIEMMGWTPKEFAENTGIPYSTVMGYLPDKFKEKAWKQEAVKSVQNLTTKQTITTPVIGQESVKEVHETPITFTRPPEDKPREFLEHPVVCSVCGISTRMFPELYPTIDGKTYCDKCVERAKPKPKEPKEAVEKATALKNLLMDGPPDAPEDEETITVEETLTAGEARATVNCLECGELFQIIHNRDGSHTLTKVK